MLAAIRLLVERFQRHFKSIYVLVVYCGRKFQTPLRTGPPSFFAGLVNESNPTGRSQFKSMGGWVPHIVSKLRRHTVNPELKRTVPECDYVRLLLTTLVFPKNCIPDEAK